MRIICGTDFSVHATEGAKVAAALAVRSNGSVELLHALPLARLEFLSELHQEYLRDILRRKLVAEADRLRMSGVDVVEKLALGRPHEVLAGSSRHFKADLIVVSTLGQIAPSRWLVGSVAERTAQSAAVPTLMVRDHEPLTEWAAGKRALNVLVGYDFSPSTDAALRWVTSLTQIGPCNITVIHHMWHPPERRSLGIGGHIFNGAIPPKVRESLECDFKERCTKLLGNAKAELRVVSGWGGHDDHLIALAKAGEADLIVVGTNQRRGLNRLLFGSTSRGVLHHAPTNVACVPESVQSGGWCNGVPAFKRVLSSHERTGLQKKQFETLRKSARGRSKRPVPLARNQIHL